MATQTATRPADELDMKDLMDAMRDEPTSPSGRIRSRPMVGGVVIALASCVATFALTGAAPAPTRTVPYSEKAVIKSEMLGSNKGVEDFAPAVEPHRAPKDPPAPPVPAGAAASLVEPIQADERELHTEVKDAPRPRRSDPVAQEKDAPCEQCISDREMALNAQYVALDETPEALVAPPAVSAAAPATINIGTRLRFALTDAVTTGAVASPVTAQLSEDVARDGRTVLPRGATLVGEAYATAGNDRVQVVISALVVNGRTVPIRGAVLGVDGDLGLTGKVVRKGSKTRSGLGKVVGAIGQAAQNVGSGLTFGVIPHGGLVGYGASELTSEVGSDLSRVGQVWSVSDKGVRVLAGAPGVLHLQADLVVP